MNQAFDAEAFVRTVAEALDLPIRPEWFPAVVANLAATAAHAELVLSFPLGDDVELAPVFEA
jgi:hypothetical protein